MEIYILLIISVIFSAFLNSNYFGKYGKKVYLFLICIYLTFIAGLRHYSIGNDTYNYVRYFEGIYNYRFSILSYGRFELGYMFLNFIISKIYSNYSFLLLICALITNIFICVFIYKYSKNVCYSVILFILCRFFFNEMNVVREMIAVGIFLYSIKYIENKNFIKYTLCIIISSFIHKSAMLLLLIYFLNYIELTKKIKFWTFSGTIFSFVFLYSILIKITSFIGAYNSYVGKYINSNKVGNIVYFFVALLIYLFVNIIRTRSEKKDLSFIDNFSYNILFINVLINFLAIRISILTRICLYLNIFYIIAIPNYIRKIKNLNKRCICYIIFFICFLAYFLIVLYLRPEWNYVNPYRFFWE